MSTDGNIFNGLSAEQAAWRLLTDFGFSVIPLKPRDKVPFGGWKKYQYERPTEDQMDAWAEEHENCNWGVVTGQVSGLVVFDCDGPEAIDWAKEHLPVACIQVETGKGVHLYYRYPQDDTFLRGFNPKTMGLPADIRKEGGYVVAPQSVHPSGKTYTIRMLGDSWADAPEFQILEPETGSGKNDLNIDLSHERASYTIVTKGDRNNFLTAEAGRLFARGLSRERVLTEIADTNRVQCSPLVSPRELVTIVDSVAKSEARNHPERREKKEQERQAKAEQTDMTGVKLVTATDPLEQYPIDDDLLHPGGLLEEMMEYGAQASFQSHPLYLLAGAITVLGTVAAQKVRSPTGLITSMYCVCVGASGSGKDAPKQMVQELLSTCAPGAYGGSDVSSETAILSRLALQDNGDTPVDRRICLVIDEIGLFLRQAGQPLSAKAGVPKLLTETTGRYNCRYTKIYAKASDNKDIPWYALSLCGMSVPEEFYGNMRSNESTNGFLARLTVFELSGEKPAPKNRNTITDVPLSLARRINDIWTMDCGERHADKLPIGGHSCDPRPKPWLLTYTEPANAYYLEQDALADKQAMEHTAAGRRAQAAVWRRVGETAIKLTMQHCISRLGASVHGGGDLLELDDVRWGWGLATILAKRLCAALELSIYRNDFEKLCQDIKLAIMSYQRREQQRGNKTKPGAPKSAIIKKVAKCPERMLDEAINILIKGNEIRMVEGWKASASPNSRRAMNLYCLVEEQETTD